MLRPISISTLSTGRRTLAVRANIFNNNFFLGSSASSWKLTFHRCNHSECLSPQLSKFFASRPYSATSTDLQASSPFSYGRGKKLKKKHKFVPRKAAVQLTENARLFFRKLLEANPNKAGIILNYHQASTGEPRMVFSFDFVTKDQLGPEDEG